ncbi:MAG: peroxiredoxin [Dehalococcoidia bacterium]|nr:peroxiredoxin [Dehalococcoidia bacterium]
MLQVGAKAPEFEGVLDDGTAFRLSEALGRGPVVLYFYPKDFTGGCTKEACSFRDNFGAIGAAGATLVGVSADNEDSHTRFREKHGLPFPLLADTEKRIVDAFDARGSF